MGLDDLDCRRAGGNEVREGGAEAVDEGERDDGLRNEEGQLCSSASF